MAETANFLAVDLGASSGRVLLGTLSGERFELRELHRFANGPVRVKTSLYWNPLELWTQIQRRTQQVTPVTFTAPLEGIGVDTWGVDFALLGRARRPPRQPAPLPRQTHRRDDGTGI